MGAIAGHLQGADTFGTILTRSNQSIDVRSMRRALRRLVFRIIAKFLGGRINIKPNLVLFGAMNGRRYGDNSRHIYEWMLRNKRELQPVWITSSKAVYDELKRSQKPVALSTSVKGFLLLFRASVATYTNGLLDLSVYPDLMPASLSLVLLTHGSGAKAVRYARLDKLPEGEHRARQKESTHVANVISTSEFVAELAEKTFRLGQDKHAITGFPRNDSLFQISDTDSIDWQRFLNGRNPHRIILYGPTWRHGRQSTQFFPFEDLDVDRLLSFVEETKTLLLLRPHINELASRETMRLVNELVSRSEMIVLASHETFPDSHLLMRFADALISDYSGLIHDYLLLDRPFIFIPYDYDDYARKNGFLYDYFKNLPGRAVDSFEDLISSLEEIVRGADPYKDQRRALCDKIHLYKDGHSCKRVAALIERILEATNNERQAVSH